MKDWNSIIFPGWFEEREDSMSDSDKKPQSDVYQAPDLSMPIEQRVRALENAITKDPNYNGFWAPFGPSNYWFRDRCADKIDLEDGPDKASIKNVRLVSVKEGHTSWELDIEPHLCNKGQNLHGGAACTILDNLTSTALLTLAKPGFLDGGHVSRTITMSYLRPVPMHSTATIECKVVAAGKNTANLYGEIKIDGKVCVTCIHDKAVFSRGSGRGKPPISEHKL